MSKRPVDPDKIANELAGASSFFKPRVAPTPEAGSKLISDQLPEKALPTPAEPRPTVRPVRPIKRQMIRHPFELYMDQLERLRETASAERATGGAGSMSKMVRDAIDRFLDHLPPAAG